MVLASAGDVVTMESLAAAQILRERVPDLRVRFVNVVDIMSLTRPKDHPHGMSDRYFDELFTDDRNVIFAFHGYPGAVHQIVHGRPDADRFRARGFLDHGTTTTPFDMVVRNRVDRYHLVMDALNNAARTVRGSEALYAWCEQQLARHEMYVVEHSRTCRRCATGPGVRRSSAPTDGPSAAQHGRNHAVTRRSRGSGTMGA